MDGCLQAHGEKIVYPVPTGLHELMSDIAREVLREQPTDIYRFIWKYLESIYKLREVTKYAIGFVTDLIEKSTEEVDFFKRYHVSREIAHKAANVIQNVFKMYQLRKALKKQQQEEIAKKQAVERESTLNYLNLNNINITDAVDACRVIQKYYRKYRASKESEKLNIVLPTLSSEMVIDGSSQSMPNKRVRDPNKLVYEQSPQNSVLSTWSTMELFEPNVQAYKLVVDRVHPTEGLAQKASSIEKKVDMSFFRPSGDLMGKTSDTVLLMTKEMDRIEEQTRALLYPPVPEEFHDLDFTEDESTDRYVLPQKPEDTFVSRISNGVLEAPQVEERLLDVNELQEEASKTGSEGLEMLEIDEKTSDTPNVPSKDASIKSPEETSSITRKDSKGSKVSKRSSRAGDVAEALEETPTVPREDAAADEGEETPEELSAPIRLSTGSAPIRLSTGSAPGSSEHKTSTRLSAAELLERVSKSSLSAEPRRASNVSASELLDRVSKSSVAKSAKSASETPRNGQNDEVEMSSGDFERHSKTDLQEVTEGNEENN